MSNMTQDQVDKEGAEVHPAEETENKRQEAREDNIRARWEAAGPRQGPPWGAEDLEMDPTNIIFAMLTFDTRWVHGALVHDKDMELQDRM